jgi:tetratricopeptide (TPR) repeat protein
MYKLSYELSPENNPYDPINLPKNNTRKIHLLNLKGLERVMDRFVLLNLTLSLIPLMKFTLTLILTLVIWSAAYFPGFASDGSELILEKGWTAFNANKRMEAKQHFIQATNDAKTKEEAHLVLSLIYWSEDNYQQSYENFTKFFQASANPYPYVYALWLTGCINRDFGKKLPLQVQFLNQLVNDPKANGTIKAMAHYMLGNHQLRTLDFDGAAKHFNSLGAIEPWQMTGNFDNTSGSGFDKTYDCINSPQDNATFTNKSGATVGWVPFKAVKENKWTDFSYAMSYYNSIVFAQTFVNSPVDQDLILRAGVSGSMKVWINDKLLITVAEERNTDLDAYSCTAKLNKGYNRILVQLGASEMDMANFMIRLTDANANPIPNLTAKATYQAYTKAADYTSQPVPLFAETFFEEKTKTAPNAMLGHLIQAEAFMRNDKTYEARKSINAIRKQAPANSFIAFRLLDIYGRSKNRTELSKEMEWLKENDAENLLSLNFALSDAQEKEDYDEVEKLIAKMEKISPDQASVIEERIQLLTKREKYDEMIKLANAAYEKYPDNYRFVLLKYAIESEVNKNPKAGISVLEKYVKKNFDEEAIRQLASAQMKAGNTEKGLKYMQDMLKVIPYATGYYDMIANTYFKMRQYPMALEWAQKTLEMAPYTGKYWEKLGKIYSEMGQDKLAKEAYQKCIEYAPDNYEIRKRLRTLESKKDLYTYFPETNVYDIYKKSPKADQFPEDNSIILHHEVQRIVYGARGAEEKTVLLIKVFNSTGIDDWKEYSIPYNAYSERLIVEKAEIIKSNGNKIAAETNGGYVVFTALEAGDALHLTYRVESYASGPLASHFWSKFHFNYFQPSQYSKYSLLIAKDKKFDFKLSNSDLKPTIQDAEDFKLYVWEAKNQASIKGETYMPPLTDVGQVLHVSSFSDWNDIAKWYSDISTIKAKSDYEVKETVNQLFEGKSKLSETEKAKLIYEYILKNIRYSSVSFRQGAYTPQKASTTLNTKLGDCKDVSTLFVAMATEVGLKANLVLVDTRENGEKDMVLPSVEFNHCIAWVKADGKEYYLELTAENLPFGTLTQSLKNALVLPIPREPNPVASQLANLNSPNRPINSIRRETEMRLENNDLVIKKRNMRTGLYTESYRSQYATIGKEAQEKNLLQSISEDYTNAVKLVSSSFKDLEGLSETAESEYVISVKNGTMDIGGMKIITLPWTDRDRSMDFLSLDKRVFPLNLWQYDQSDNSKEIITLFLPAGKTLAEVPKSQNISCKALDYSLTFKVEPGKLIAIRETTIKKDVISMGDYLEFKELFTKIVESDAQKVGIK